jgi:nitrite reductase (NADH) small subunit
LSATAVRVCRADALPPGERILAELAGESIGVFNVAGSFFALRDRCPHRGGPLCRGPITGETCATSDFDYSYDRAGRILRCAWHGWEFDIETGRSLVDPSIRAKTFPVTVEDGDVVVHVG